MTVGNALPIVYLMKATTKAILDSVWNRNQDLCGTMANCIERREGWDDVLKLWGKPLPQRDWRTYQDAFAAEWG